MIRRDDKPAAREILQALLSTAKLETMKGIYERIAPGSDGRLRTSLSVVGTISGRFSSSATFLEPGSTNLQNLPKKTAKLDPLYDVRSCLQPDRGMVLIEADFSQAELYAYLAFAEDWQKLNRLIAGEDVHRDNAAALYEKDRKEIAKDDPERIVGKFMSYSLGYKCGWKTFRDRVNSDADITDITISAKEAKRAVNVWRQLNRRTVRWWDEIEREMRQEGRLVNPFGRVRTLIDQSGSALNSAISWLPQSTVADALNRGLRRVYEALDPEAAGRRSPASCGPFELLLQVHDSVVGQTPLDGWKRTADAIARLMTEPVEINGRRVPIPVEIEASSRSWAEVEEV